MVFTRKDGDFHGLLLLVSGRVTFDPFTSNGTSSRTPFPKCQLCQRGDASMFLGQNPGIPDLVPKNILGVVGFCFGAAWMSQEVSKRLGSVGISGL